MSMMWMRMPGQGWVASGLMFILMWIAMMIAMMLPSALPMLAQFGQNSGSIGHSGSLPVGTGYFAVWTAFGAAVYLPGATWAALMMESARLSRTEPALGAFALIVAGAIQLSKWKVGRLNRCRNPKTCCEPGQTSWREKFQNGIREGVYCVACCSGHMVALVALGAMDPMVMTVIAIIIASEKILPRPRIILEITGFVGILAGGILLARAVF